MKQNKIELSQVTSKNLSGKKYLDTFPEYYELAKVTENGLWHRNQNVLDHVIKVFKGLETVLQFEKVDVSKKRFLEEYLSRSIGNRTRKEILIVATLLHDIAKSDTLVISADGRANCPGHELIAASRVKNFSNRFDLNNLDEQYVERIVRYHGFIANILDLIIANKDREKYLSIFKETVGDITIELILLMHADLLGSDLKTSNEQAFNERIELLSWMLDNL